ncbi:MAG: hypothetical protein Q9227_005720 [Pyrenula ochraceoflavens]
MGSFVFKWQVNICHTAFIAASSQIFKELSHQASEVFVTGTFDDWAKSVKLEKVGDSFEKEVQLPKTDEKILYKFVADGDWTTDHTAPSETDSSGNVNNVLLPEHIKKPSGEAAFAGAAMSGVTADSTTAKLAGEVPKESEKTASAPGAFPETPANEAKDFSVNPIPASEGIGNPVKLAPGEKVPHPSEITSNTVDSKVTTSKEDYEKDASASLPAPAKATTEGDSAFSVPEKSGNLIPESSLPMGDGAKDTTDSGPHISSVGPTSTTAGLAAQVPMEPKREATVEGADKPAENVPDVVKESMAEAHKDPEAAASSEEVKEKKEFEQELLKEVKTTDATGEPAPSATAATTETAPAPTQSSSKPDPETKKDSLAEPEPRKEREPSRDLSPMTKDPNAPTVTTGIDASSAPGKSTPANGTESPTTPTTPTTKDKKKKNRLSAFLGKFKSSK